MVFVLPKRPNYSSVDSLEDSYILKKKYVSIKLDGHWTAVHVEPFGKVSVFTRTGEEITPKIRVNEWYQQLLCNVRGPITIIGELWRKDLPCSSISTALANGDPLKFYPFHVEGINDFKYAKEYCYMRNLNFIPYNEGPFSALQLQEYFNLYSQAFHPADGLVFSDGPGLNIIKWKESKTIDLVLYTWRRGKGKYKHTLGKIVCRTAEGYTVAATSGMTDVERDYIKNNFDQLRGQVVEIKYNGIGVHGRLRHPRYLGFRRDKLQSECSVSQDPELEKIWKSNESK